MMKEDKKKNPSADPMLLFLLPVGRVHPKLLNSLFFLDLEKDNGQKATVTVSLLFFVAFFPPFLSRITLNQCTDGLSPS